MNDTDINPPSGGSGITVDLPPLTQNAPSEPPPAAGENQPPTSPQQETVVVPGSSGQTGNPFIPQGVVPEEPSTIQSHGDGSVARRLIMIVILLFVIGGLAVGGKFLMGLFSGVKEVTITYWGLWENDSIIKPVIDAFEAANPKIKVQYVKNSPKQYRERLQAAITRGEGPDVFRFHNTWVAMLKNDLALVPNTVMTTTEFAGTFYPIANASLVAGTSIFGIPLEIEGLGLYYNEDLFAKAGVKVPTTWEEMLDVVPKLTVRSDTAITTSAIALGTTGNIENYSDILATMMLQNGVSLVNPTGKEAEETFVFYRKFATPSDPVYTWNDTLDNSIYAFAMGKVAMILAPSWRAFDIKQMNPDLRFKIAQTPQLPGTNVNWASFWVEGVSSKSKYPEQSWKFIKYLTSKEGASKLYTEASKLRLFGEPYARVDMASMLTDDPYAGAYVKQAVNAKTFPLASRTFDNGINDKLIKYLEDAINGLTQGSAPTSVLGTMAAGFRQVLSTYGLVTAAPPAAQ